MYTIFSRHFSNKHKKKEQKKIRNRTDQMDKRRDENERLVKFCQWGSF